MEEQSATSRRQDEPVEGRDRLQELRQKFLPSIKASLLISLILNLIMFIMGIYGVNKCPVNDNIPLFLLATGGIGMFSKFISYIKDRLRFQVKYFESALYTVETVFLILGIYWIFKVYKPSYDPHDGIQYCNKTVYIFSLVYVSLYVLIPFIILIGFLCFLICIWFVKATESNTQDVEAQNQPENNADGSNAETKPLKVESNKK